jgi:protein-tyrosine phosphatase
MRSARNEFTLAVEKSAMHTRRAWIRRAILIVIAGVGAEQLWRHGHDYVFPSKFVVVEPGKIFRGAWQKPWPFRQIVRDLKIKTVVALAHPADHALSIQERKLASELGVRWIHIPIVDQRGTNDRVAEDAISDLLDQAAAVLADPKNYPVFFHCHHGLNRTSMVQIAYRTKYCGWTLAQAADEIERSVGLVKVNHGPDYRHMVSFYENRVLPLRGQHSNAPRETKSDVTARLEQAPTAPAVR